MAGQQNLTSVITIRGNVDSSVGSLSKMFDQWGDTLLNIGNYINPISQKITEFGKESVQSFASYEDMQLKVKAVGEFTKKEMEALDAAARQVGRTSRYTAQDASEAELILSQVGLGYKEIISLLPDVLTMAQAGDISIATSADYLYSSLKSMGVGLDYVDTWIDQMAKTASIGSTDIDTLGQSITRLGSTAQLIKGGPEQILAILSAMSEYGEDMRGLPGGTALRNFFLSLAAPLGNGKEIMAFLGSVGSSMEELDEIMEGVELTSAAAAIKDLGLDVYDAAGNLNNGIDIIRDLRDTMAGLTEEQQKKTLSQIFGKRTITTAMNLIKLTDEEWNQLMADIKDSDGYAQSMAETQEGGLGGALRLLKSQFEDLKITVGDSLAEPVKQAAAGIGDMIGYLSSLDESTRQNWVTVMGAIAAAGPAMLGIGGFMKLLAFATTPAGGVALAIIGFGALAGILKNIEETNLADTFGTMELDMSTLTPHVTGLATEFSTAVASLSEYTAGIETAYTAYSEASGKLASDLLTATITGAVLTDTDVANLANLGGQMLDATIAGIKLKQTESNAFIQALFAGTGEGETEQNIIDAQNAQFQGLFAHAHEIGQTLRDQMTEALRDGSLDSNENEAIVATVGRLNAINAQIADMQNRQEYEKLLHKGQSTSLDSLREFTDLVTGQRDRALADMSEVFQDSRAWTKIGYDDRIAGAATSQERESLIREQQESMGAMDRAFQQRVTESNAQYAGLIAEAWSSALKSSDFGGMYKDLIGFSQDALKDGGALTGDWFDQNNIGDLTRLIGQLEQASDAMGGFEGLTDMMNLFQQSGAPAPAWLSTMSDMLNALKMAEAAAAMAGPGMIVPEGYDQMLAAADQLAQLQSTGSGQGANYAGAFSGAVEAGSGAATSAGNALGAGAAAGVDAALAIHSPSRVGIEQGINYVLGLALGIDEGLGLVQQAGAEAGEAAAESAGEGLSDVLGLTTGKSFGDMFTESVLGDLGVSASLGGALHNGIGSIFLEAEPLVEGGIASLQKILEESGFELPKFGVDNLLGSETSTALQQAMTKAGYELPKYGVDGIIGTETASTLQQMLTDFGFELPKFGIDGILGEETMTALQQYIKWLEENDQNFGVKPPVPPETPTPSPQPETTGDQSQNTAYLIDTVLNTPDTTPVAEAIAMVGDTDISVSVLGDTSSVNSDIAALDGRSAKIRLLGDDSDIDRLLASGYTAKVRLQPTGGGLPGFAEGGRTTTPAIFGEVPGMAEWAIPEEHSDRTKELLTSAAAASGFSWAELLNQRDGLNAGPGGGNRTLIYAPVIHAKDATDVEDKLIADKKRLDEWWESKRQSEERMKY